MKTRTKNLVVGVVLLLLVLASIPPVSAAKTKGYTGYSIGLSGVLNMLTSEAAKMARKGIIIYSANLIHYFYLSVFDNMPSLIKANPPMWSIKHFMGFFINLMQPFYIAAIMLTGFYIIFVSQSPLNRARAKKWFGKLIIGLVLISVSPLLVELLYYVSGSLTSQIMNLADITIALGSLRAAAQDLFDTFVKITLIHRYGGIEIFLLDTVLLMALYLILFIRYIMAGLMAVLLPVTIFFYSWDLTRNAGKMMFEQTIIWIFLQLGWAVGLIIVSVTVATLPVISPNLPLEFIYATSLIFMFAVPFMILGVMNWMGLSIFMFEIVQAAPLSSGAVVVSETTIERKPFEEEEVVIKPPEDY
ncbi:MAG: hypothetical protein U9M95_03460 [Candidatus Altiarchaeota archaeon]|nr:hypothetical protein [Candidatus Altiarchaeota archaeon]